MLSTFSAPSADAKLSVLRAMTRIRAIARILRMFFMGVPPVLNMRTGMCPLSAKWVYSAWWQAT